jgi:hypothetical protein
MAVDRGDQVTAARLGQPAGRQPRPAGCALGEGERRHVQHPGRPVVEQVKIGEREPAGQHRQPGKLLLTLGEQDAGRRVLDVRDGGQYVEVEAVIRVPQGPAAAARLAGLRPVGMTPLLLPPQVGVQQVADAPADRTAQHIGRGCRRRPLGDRPLGLIRGRPLRGRRGAGTAAGGPAVPPVGRRAWKQHAPDHTA